MIGKYKCEHCGSITNIKDWRVESNNAYNFKYYHCPVCDKENDFPRRILEQNNEEWFINLPTKEKAKWLENKMTWAAQEQGTFTAKGWEKWLKEEHVEEPVGNYEIENDKPKMTNEDWFVGLSTWEKANVIAHKFFGGDEDECKKMYYYFGDWLKAVHK